MSTVTSTEQTTTYRASKLEDLGRTVDEALGAIPEGWSLSNVDVESLISASRDWTGTNQRTHIYYLGRVTLRRIERT